MRKLRYIISIPIAIILLTTLAGCFAAPKTPTIEYGEFPFRFVYELNGEIYIVEDTVVCEFRGIMTDLGFLKSRRWSEYLKNGRSGWITLLRDENVYSILTPDRLNTEISVALRYGTAEYYMGDPTAQNMTHNKPQVWYLESYDESDRVSYSQWPTAMSDEQLEKHFGIKVIEFTFSDPIKNEFK